MKTVLLTDLDNTIYNWVDFYAPCFRAMVHTVSDHTSLDEKVVVQQFRDVFEKFGSLEYPFSIQKLAVCSEMPPPEIKKLVNAGTVAFGRTRRRRLKPYPG